MKLFNKVSILFASLALVMGAGLVGSNDAKEVKADSEYAINFDCGTNDNGTLAASNILSNTATKSNTLVKTVVSSGTIYTGATNGIRLGKSKGTGYVTFEINSEAQSNIKEIVIVSGKYGSDTGKLKITANNSELVSTITPGGSTTLSDNIPDVVSTFKIETTSKRAYLSSIKFVISEKPQVTSVTLSPSNAVTLPVGQSKIFTVGIEGINLTGEEIATLSFKDGGDGFELSNTTAKNGETIKVTANNKDAIDELVATCNNVDSNVITIMAEEAKVLNGIEIQGTLAKSIYLAGEKFDSTGLTVIAKYDSNESLDVTEHVIWSPEVITKDTTSVTATYVENGVSKSDSIAVSVKTLSKITVDTNPILNYEDGDKLDLSGMVVTKHYSDDSTAICSDYTTAPANGDVLSIDNKTLTITVDGVEDVILDLIVTPVTFKEYKLVTNDNGDLSGTYLIVYKASETEGRSFDGRDAANDYNTIDLSENKATHTNKEVDNRTVTLEKMNNGYSIKINGGENAGKYISGTKNSNTINFDDEASEVMVEFDDNGVALISSNTSVLRYNSASNNNRFRFFKEASYDSQQPVYLFRQMSETDKFVDEWNETIRDSEGGFCNFLSKDKKDILKALIEKYNALDDDAKADLVDKAGVKISDSIKYAEAVWKGTQSTDKNYDVNSGVIITSNYSIDSTSLIALFALLGIGAISAYYFIEKKKLSK